MSNTMFTKILFPIDESREARQAAEIVSQLVKLHNSQLVILSVVEDSVVEDEDKTMSSPETVDQLLANAKDMFAQQGITAETIERSGKPAFTICDVADDISANLIVMGSRGLGLTDEGAGDSVTHRVLSLSPCPVLVVP
jgi:nucleotide-binding universal stress UspA family protein